MGRPGRKRHGNAGLEDVLRMEQFEELWDATPGSDGQSGRAVQGVVCLDVTVADAFEHTECVLPFVNAAASVTSKDGSVSPCSGWFTVVVMAMDNLLVPPEGVPSGRVETFEPLFGDVSELDYVHPWPRSPGRARIASKQSFVVSHDRPHRVSCPGWDGHVLPALSGAYNWVVFIVYSLEGCGTAKLHAQAGLCAVAAAAHVGERAPERRRARVLRETCRRAVGFVSFTLGVCSGRGR
jgi:hypothetical protein